MEFLVKVHLLPTAEGLTAVVFTDLSRTRYRRRCRTNLQTILANKFFFFLSVSAAHCFFCLVRFNSGIPSDAALIISEHRPVVELVR